MKKTGIPLLIVSLIISFIIIVITSCESNDPYAVTQTSSVKLRLSLPTRYSKSDIQDIHIIILEEEDTIHNTYYHTNVIKDTIEISFNTTARFIVHAYDSLAGDIIFKGDTSLLIPEEKQITVPIRLIPIYELENFAPYFTKNAEQMKDTAHVNELYSDSCIAFDPNADTMTFYPITIPAGATIDSANGTIRWQPDNTLLGDHDISIGVKDEEGLSDTISWKISVVETNRAPLFTSKVSDMTNVIAIGAKISDTCRAMDPNSDSLTFFIINIPAGGTLDVLKGIFTWTPGKEKLGKHPVSIGVTDPKGLTDTLSWEVQVQDTTVNNAPIFTTKATDLTTEISVGQKVSDTCKADDSNGGPLSFTLLKGPYGATADKSLGIFSWTPIDTDTGIHDISLEVQDTGGLSDTLNWTITVTEKAANLAPYFTVSVDNMNSSGVVGTITYDTCKAVDPENGTLTFYSLERPDGAFYLDSLSGIVSWMPYESHIGTHSISIMVKDTGGLSDTLTWKVTVVDSTTNQVPKFTKIDSEMKKDATVGQVYMDTCKAEDPNKDPITFFIASTPIVGLSIDPNSGAIRWQPTSDQVGDNIAVIGVKDDKGLADTLIWTITVKSPNQAPQFTKLASQMKNTVAVGSTYDDTLQAEDPDGDVFSYHLTDPVQNLTVTESNGVVKWTPTTDQIGVTTIQVYVKDIHGNINELAWDITVTKAPLKDSTVAGMKFIPTKGDTFTMGSTSFTNEQPIHKVTFTHNLLMDSTEVTQLAYRTVMSDKVHGFINYAEPLWSAGPSPGDNFPAYSINWFDAALYCNALSKMHGLDTVYSYLRIAGTPGSGVVLEEYQILYSNNGYRLPTEAEWEYCAKAGTSTKYYWGDETAKETVTLYAVYYENSSILGESHADYGPQAVAQKKPNALGLYDMSGNVSEFCTDWYGNSYAGDALETDPSGISGGFEKVKRGGNWTSYTSSNNLGSTNRESSALKEVSHLDGFRVVRRY